MTKVLFRKYTESGEIIAIMPNVAGDPDGDTCVAYAAAGGFYHADLDTVIGNTKPAEAGEYNRLKVALGKEDTIDHLTVLGKKPAGSKDFRKADTDAHTKFDRVARSHAYR